MVYTDVIQAVVLILGTILMTWIVFADLGFSWDKVVASVPEGHLSMVQPLDHEVLPWPGIILGVSLLGFWYWVTNQYIVQRVLGAKSVQHAQWGCVLAGGLKIIPLFTMVLPGAMAISLFPNLQNADMVFPTLVTEVLPVGIVGLVLAGLIAAIMSSVDSTLNSASTLVVHDFIEPHHPEFKPEKVGTYGRIATLVFMILAILWAPMIAGFGGLWSYIQQAFSILVPPIAAIFLVGAFWRRANGQGAFMALIIGHIVGLLFFILMQLGVWPVHFTINVGFMTIFSAIVLVVFSLRSAPPDPERVERTTWRPEMAVPEVAVAWYKDYRFLSVVVGIAMLAVLIGFW